MTNVQSRDASKTNQLLSSECWFANQVVADVCIIQRCHSPKKRIVSDRFVSQMCALFGFCFKPKRGPLMFSLFFFTLLRIPLGERKDFPARGSPTDMDPHVPEVSTFELENCSNPFLLSVVFFLRFCFLNMIILNADKHLL